MKKLNAQKSLALILAIVLAVGSIVGTTMAWLIDTTDEVTNTFTYGDINIDLEETDTELDDDDDKNTNEYEMIPGQEITKDPWITVKANSENCWLFVKLDESENFDDFLTYTIGEGWVPLKGTEGVYYRFQGEIAADADDVKIQVLKDDKVYVKAEVTKEQLNALNESADVKYPTMKVTAYAVQYAGFEPVISEGATEPTAEQVEEAAVKAWTEAVKANTPAETTPPTETVAP